MRVAEKVNDVWRFLIYDIGGKCIAEYGGAASTDEGGVKYPLKDWQGSTRGSISSTGNVRSRQDFTAFGEEIGAGTGLRTSAQGFGASDTLREKYGLTERDDATGLDHTWFRKHENQAGRWTSPDPYNGSMSLGSSQSFNRYVYVGNDPVNFVDPSGLMMCGAEYSYDDCGGGSQFWGGAGSIFGDHYAYWYRPFEGMSPTLRDGILLYEEMVSNAQAGYGFMSHSAVMEMLAATFWISYGFNADGSLWTNFNLNATFHYSELRQPRSNLNANAQALIQEMGKRGPALQKITTAMGIGAATIIAAPVVADVLIAAGATSTTQAVVANVTGSASRMGHIFASKHLLQPLVARFGSQGAVVHQVVNSLNGLPANRVFTTSVNVAGYNVVVTGRTVIGVPFISNFWIPK